MYLNEATLLHNLKLRYNNDVIYVSYDMTTKCIGNAKLAI